MYINESELLAIIFMDCAEVNKEDKEMLQDMDDLYKKLRVLNMQIQITE